MNKKTLKVTTGGLIAAIFAVLLLINRQSGGFLQDTLMFLFPIPMVAYAAKYGWRSSLPVVAVISLLSFLLGTVTTIFYVVSECLIGTVMGGCLYKKIDPTKTLFLVMILSSIANIASTVILTVISGVPLTAQIDEMRQMMQEVIEKSGMAFPPQMLENHFLIRIFAICMIFMGLLQGFVVFEISLLLLRRLRFHVQKPKAIYEYCPPKWTGILAFLGFMGYNYTMLKPFSNEVLTGSVQMIGIFGYMYVLCFGAIAFCMILGRFLTRNRAVMTIVTFVCVFIMPQVMTLLGLWYIVGDLRKRLLSPIHKESALNPQAAPKYPHPTAGSHSRSLSDRAKLVSKLSQKEKKEDSN